MSSNLVVPNVCVIKYISLKIIIPSYDLYRELTLYSVSTIASYIKETTNHGVEVI